MILLFGAGLLWSLNGALIKLIHDDGRGPHGVTIAFYRSLFAGLFLLPMAWGRFHTLATVRRSRASGVKGGTARRNRDQDCVNNTQRRRVRPALISCVIFFTLMTVCFVIANTKTEAANAIILQYTSTFWVFGLSPWLLKERPAAKEFWLLGLAMVGIAIIFVGNASTDLPGLVIALAAGLFFGLLTMMIRRLRDSDSAAVTVLNILGSAVLLFPAVLLVGELMLPLRVWLLLLVMGVLQFGLPYYMYTLGLARIPAYRAALITMIEPVLVPVWTYLAVRESVPQATVVGGVLILAALILFARSAGRGGSRTA